MQELGTGSFEIREQPNCLKRGLIKVLSLIDDDQHFSPGTRFIHQHFSEPLVQQDFITPGIWQLKLRSEKAEQVKSSALRLKEKSRARRFAVLRQ
jgi:hypothetical protein